MVDKLEKVKAEIERCINRCNAKIKSCPVNTQVEAVCLNKISAYKDVLCFIDSLQEEPCNSCQGFNDKDKFDELVFTHNCPIVKNPVSIWHDASIEPPKTDKMILVDKKGLVFLKTILINDKYDWKDCKYAYIDELLNLTTKEESVSEDLEEVANKYGKETFVNECMENGVCDKYDLADAFKAGAKWQKENLWKPADGDDLPKIDREVIAILDNGKVVFAHRPPEYWDGKNIITGKVTRNYPKTYDKGGWNIPNVKYWLDCQIPKIDED